VQKDNLYRCLDNLLAHKTHLFSFLQQRWTTLFEAKFEVMLYDLTRVCRQIGAGLPGQPRVAAKRKVLSLR
jgi:hypothetical protein